ncbi:hypothetical protein [Actinacidiphila acidipaludis]|uniref:Uncharacterized protein n=1 Tax=Actinacidiphila acidipaludis TaxID=2873382 RepID=A0ABS7Q549_9ACTN|nr:hypothetical protein [Streptomyces acidipaludis]MBY8878278.1 hypothetical protein [Streptomyces acidipaludis]
MKLTPRAARMTGVVGSAPEAANAGSIIACTASMTGLRPVARVTAETSRAPWGRAALSTSRGPRSVTMTSVCAGPQRT